MGIIYSRATEQSLIQQMSQRLPFANSFVESKFNQATGYYGGVRFRLSFNKNFLKDYTISQIENAIKDAGGFVSDNTALTTSIEIEQDKICLFFAVSNDKLPELKE